MRRKKEALTADTTRFMAKFYITKLITFSSELEGKSKKGGFAKNFSLCPDCYKEILAGMRYLDNYLRSNLAGNTFWIIPGLFFNPLESQLTKRWIEIARDHISSILDPDNALSFRHKIERELEDYRRFEELADLAHVHLLFYEKSKSAFKVKKLIREIPLRWIQTLNQAFLETKALGDEVLGNNGNPKKWLLSLKDIYTLIPLRSGNTREYKKILDLYESILSRWPLERSFLMQSFLTLSAIYLLEKPGYNIHPGKNPQLGLTFALLQGNLLLQFLEKLNILQGGGHMTEPIARLLPESITRYVEKMGYSEEATALFLLGYMIGAIGAEQVRGADFNAKKPILNKINVNGMNSHQIRILSNEVFEKLDQYRIRGYYEKTFAVMKSLLDPHISRWSLSDAESVFYLLSGYSFYIYERIQKAQTKEENQ